MKRLFLSLFALLCLGSGLYAQTCTPDAAAVASGVGGPHPSPVDGLPDAMLNQAYTQTITMVIPQDTTIDFSQFFPGAPVFTATLNTWKITNVSGLPAGMSYQCDATSCNWNGGSNGCLKLSGTPTAAGTFTIQLESTINVNLPPSIPLVGGTPYDIPSPVPYTLNVIDPASVEEGLNANTFSAGQSAPNPASETASVKFNMTSPGRVAFKVVNQLGQVMHASEMLAGSGFNTATLNTSTFAPGMYFYFFENGTERTNVCRMTVTH